MNRKDIDVIYDWSGFGGTKISSAISDPEGKILNEVSIATEGREDEEKVMERILDSIRELLKKTGADINEVISAGIGTPGIINKKEGKILRVYNLPFENYDILKPIKEMLS